MPPRIENYHGREQSFIKHLFLNKYLESAAYKLFQGRSPVFNFVDAFAGPWRVSDTNRYSDASFSQAIETLETVRRSLLDMGRPGLQVRFRFCERNPVSVAKLREFAAQKPEFDIQVFSGQFEDNLDGIRTACRDGFTFTFIDPTGWNVESAKVFEFLRSLNGEFLFNFMAEEVNRHAGWDGVAASVGRFLADPAWKDAFEAMPEGSNETKILQLLKAKMKEARVATYLTDMAIRKPREDRIKMRLILGTHSGIGVEVFRTVQEKVEKEAVRTRHAIQTEESRQSQLFPEDQIIAFETDRDGVGCSAHVGWATELLLQTVSKRPGIAFGPLASEVMELVPVRTTHLNKIATANRKAGLLRFDLPNGKRTPSPDTRIWAGTASDK
ncbi:three-Cys-motif partner protein TcmP [Paracoccus sp. Arc7-R13]|jgi:three-Cys-motif partner protein|uniref:three-Cys-motif partner protein TcmP n=1 Tax=Paracoccus sp. Arc7-R13 TaxID=2500532 RepID=UPI000FDCC473|nr:three-Cys-motif partner protein TcmP [Paracoccus sp. Arc7-R13]AZY93999.1 three-Cys-motif partner protein TcmP [Paracoccus sp. Arc7-R13]